MIKRSLLLGILVLLLMALPNQSLATLYPKVGVICCGDLWETFAPSGIYKDYGSSDTNILANWQIIRLGNLERNWLTPTEMYPGGDQFGLNWSSQFVMVEYSNIANFNNYTTSTDDRAKKYAYAFTMPKTVGNVPNYGSGDTRGAASWTDGDRTGQIYTATGPTNIGVDMRMRARALALNEANMNDWIAVELELTNTGVQDINCDGTIDRTGHVIEALSIETRMEDTGAMGVNTAGGRMGPGFASSKFCGYDGSPDPDGNPWAADVTVATNVDPNKVDATGWVVDGERKIGIRMSGYRMLWDVWHGDAFIAVKKGGMDVGVAATDKNTIYDSPAIGLGKQRGWFTSSNRSWGNAGRNPWEDFIAATGTFYEDGGKTWSTSALKPIKPDPNWFDATKPYTPDDPLSFVGIVKPSVDRGQPMGDMKYRRKWLQNWEKNYPGTNPPIPAEDTWTDGGTATVYNNFDGDKLIGIGPFRLEVGETMTVVWIRYAGIRLKGMRQSLKSARWAYENNWNVPKPPAMPDMTVSPVQSASGGFNNRVVWDKKADASANFAGYKIYRVSAFPKNDYYKLGLQFLSNYHHQTAADIGATEDQLIARYCDPKNPNISTSAAVNTLWDGNPSGPWKIMAYITKEQLAQFANTGADAATYPYAWVDTDKSITIGYTYWYYVAAFNTTSGTMAGVNYTSLESSKANWNGRDGRWYGTYHFATANSEYPTYDLAAQKYLGAAYVLKPARVTKSDLLTGVKKIEVRPNPYKVQAPHDVGLEHKVQFVNLTADTRITILDLSGQLIDVIEYEGQDPRDGSLFWDMFTKDGPEVASGLYIWVAEFPGGQQKGYLAIQR